MTSGNPASVPRGVDEAMRDLLGVIERRLDRIRDRFVDDLRHGHAAELGAEPHAAVAAAVAGMPAALRRAAGGDWEGLRGQAGLIRAACSAQAVSRALVLDAIIALRGAVYPHLIEADPERTRLAASLAALDRLVAWFVVQISGGEGASQLEEARDAMFLRSIVENIPYMIFVKDARDLRFLRFNQAGEQLLGYRREELIGKNDYDFFPVEEADFFTGHDRQVLAGRRPVDIPEERIQTRVHGSRLLHTKKIPILDEHGAPLYLLGISEDITEQRRVQLELERAKEAAETASTAKSEFLARMSHEIRTPLNGIIGMTELALEATSTEEWRECLETVRGSAGSLLRVLNDVLDFSKIEAGRLELEAERFDLDATVRAAIKPFELRARERGLAFDYVAGPELPAIVVGDALRLRQVLLNLLDNAVRFTERGEVRVTAGVAERGAEHVLLRFRVADTGIGVPADKQASIFESFTQVDGSITRRFGGTGLGLAIVRRIVELMGGRIGLESAPGRGSAFCFTARFAVADAPARRSEPGTSGTAAPGRPGPRGPRGPLNVLVAEDHPVNLALIRRILRGLGHRAVEARDGRQVLETLARERFDLVLMDVEMPELGGLEVTRRIRGHEHRHGGHVPIVALTAHALPGDRERCLAAGMDGFVAKPLQRAELVTAMATALGTAAAPADGGDEASLDALFARQCPEDVRRIAEALRRGDTGAAARLAHGLAGAAALVGAKAIVRAARALERRLREPAAESAPDAAASLTRAVERFLAARHG